MIAERSALKKGITEHCKLSAWIMHLCRSFLGLVTPCLLHLAPLWLHLCLKELPESLQEWNKPWSKGSGSVSFPSLFAFFAHPTLVEQPFAVFGLHDSAMLIQGAASAPWSCFKLLTNSFSGKYMKMVKNVVSAPGTFGNMIFRMLHGLQSAQVSYHCIVSLSFTLTRGLGRPPSPSPHSKQGQDWLETYFVQLI